MRVTSHLLGGSIRPQRVLLGPLLAVGPRCQPGPEVLAHVVTQDGCDLVGVLIEGEDVKGGAESMTILLPLCSSITKFTPVLRSHLPQSTPAPSASSRCVGPRCTPFGPQTAATSSKPLQCPSSGRSHFRCQ